MATGSCGPCSKSTGSLDDLLKCSICFDRLQDPRTLPCLHTFCTTCLQALYNATIHNNTSLLSYDIISCPTCRTRTIVPPGGITGFPNDFKISKISEIMDNTQLDMMDDSGPIRRCDICKFTNRHIQASCFCVECSRYFCSGCIERHDSRSLLKNHQKLHLTKTKSIDMKCKIHDVETVQYFCNECKESICLHCTITGHHSNHDIIELGNGIEQCETNLKECAEELSEKLNDVSVSLNKLSDIDKQMKTILDESVELVKMRVREMIMSIKKREHQLLNQLEEHYHGNVLEFQANVEQLEMFQISLNRYRDDVSEILYKDDEAAILRASKELCPKIETALERYSNHGFDGQVNLSKFIPSKKVVKLGKIQQFTITAEKIEKENPNLFQQVPLTMTDYPRLVFMSKFTTSSAWVGEVSYPQLVGHLPSGNLVVADTRNSCIQIFDEEGNYMKTVTEGVIKPVSIAITENGSIAIADMTDRKIKIITTDGIIVMEFGTFCSPSGIAVNSKGQFVVTDFLQNSLEIYNPEYERIVKKKLHDYQGVDSVGCCQVTTDSSDCIYVSDVGDQCVNKYDSDGNFVKKFQIGSDNSRLKGICVDNNDRLIVTDENQSTVSIFDTVTEQEHVLLDKKTGLRSPSDVIITPDRHLVVVEGKADCVHVYQMCEVTWQADLPVLNSEEE